MIGVVEALLFAQKMGLDQSVLLEAIKGGAAGSFSLNRYGPSIIQGDFAPGFYVHHFVKDMNITLKEAERNQMTLPGLALVKDLYERLS